MADHNPAADEVLLDVSVAEASGLYKFYLNQEKKILGTTAVIIFLTAWELVGNTLQLINPMFMSAPSLIWKAAVQLFSSGEIYNDLRVSGIEFGWGYFLSVVVGVPFGIACGWYKKMAYIFDPFVNAMNATPRVALLQIRVQHSALAPQRERGFRKRRLPRFLRRARSWTALRGHACSLSGNAAAAHCSPSDSLACPSCLWGRPV